MYKYCMIVKFGTPTCIKVAHPIKNKWYIQVNNELNVVIYIPYSGVFFVRLNFRFELNYRFSSLIFSSFAPHMHHTPCAHTIRVEKYSF